MKNNASPLYDLIQSLSDKEVKFFRKHAKRHVLNEKNQYLTLFDILNQLPSYDTALLKQKAEGEIPNLPVIKTQLYNQLLDCLRTYHRDKSGRIRFYQYLTEAHLLFEKGLRNQSLKRINKARKLSKEYQLQLDCLPLSLLKRRVLRMGLEEKANQKKLVNIQMESSNYLKKLLKEFELRAWYEKEWIDRHNTKSVPKNPELQSQHLVWGNQIKKIDQQFPVNQLLFSGKIYYYMLKEAFYKKMQNKEQRQYCLKEILSLFEQQPNLLKSEYDYQNRYIGFLRNYFNSCFSLGHYEAFRPILEKIENIKTENIILKAQAFNVKFYILIVYNLVQKQYSEVTNLASEIEQGLADFDKVLPKEDIVTFRYNLGLAFFGCKNLKASLQYTQLILNDKRTQVRDDILLIARFLELLLYLELEEFRLVEFRILAFRQYFIAYHKKRKKKKSINYRQLQKYKILPLLEKMAQQHSTVPPKDSKLLLSNFNGEAELEIWVEKYWE